MPSKKYVNMYSATASPNFFVPLFKKRVLLQPFVNGMKQKMIESIYLTSYSN